MITNDGKIFFGMPYGKSRNLPLLLDEELRFVIREDRAKHLARCFTHELYPKANGKFYPTSPAYILDLSGKCRSIQSDSINSPST